MVGEVTVFTGMARGVDLWAAAETVAARAAGFPLRLAAVLPYPGQETRWPPADRAAYTRCLSAADEVILCHPRPPGDAAEARALLLARNARLVELVGPAGLLLAVWDGGPSGTAHTVRTAKDLGVPVFRLDPRTRPLLLPLKEVS
jgi:uncharacterized phage-like protein YoqJ